MTLNLLGYIDPAATTALISSLTAMGVAVGATFIIFWRKLKKFVFKLLHIDENVGKIMEEKLVVYDQLPSDEGAEAQVQNDDKEGQN